jgi:predicted transcriptional regulator of viral defense system
MDSFSDRMARKKTTKSLDSKVIRRIRATKSASVFSAMHFFDLGTRASVDKALSRLAKAGILRRVGRGLYDLPRTHPLLGTLSPRPEKAVEVMAKKEGIQLRPSGAASANALGLSEQVPAKIVYQTDGQSRKINIAGQQVELKHRSARQMALSPKPTGLIASALKSLGKKHITLSQLQKLRRRLSSEDRRILKKELPLVPAWMHPHFRYLSTGESNP